MSQQNLTDSWVIFQNGESYFINLAAKAPKKVCLTILGYFVLYHFLAPFEGQNIIWIFSNLRVSIFYKNIIGCPNR